MRLVILKGFRTCNCDRGWDCPYDFGCAARFELTTQEVSELPLSMNTTVRDVGEVLTLINELRDLTKATESDFMVEETNNFLGLIDQHKVERVLFQDFGEEKVIAFPLIEGDRVAWATHPDSILRQLAS